MMITASALMVFVLIEASKANDITVYNHCPFQIWPAIQGNPGYENPESGGFSLEAYEIKVLNVPNNWCGKIWARDHCDSSNGHCLTGDCGNRLKCNGVGGKPPVTLAQIYFNDDDGLAKYQVNMMDGYNLPVQISPTEYNGYDDHDDCRPAGCHEDLNAICPKELAVKMAEWTIACYTPCQKFGTEEYCCTGEYAAYNTCKSNHYFKLFKKACPDAYFNPHDNATTTFVCQGNPSLEITFCP